MNADVEFDLASYMVIARKALPEDLRKPTVLALLELSLAEDLSPAGLEEMIKKPLLNDLTSVATLPLDRWNTGIIHTKAPGVVAGLPLAEAVFKLIDPEIDFQSTVADGEHVISGQKLAKVSGPGVGLMAAERTVLNFLGHLSGVATLTRKFMDAVADTGAIILDTRKTSPGFRILDKYAVRKGGGQNHRMGLYDMVLIKNNHIDSAGGIEAAIKLVRQQYGDQYPIEAEVRTLTELKTALALRPNRIMLDNMDLDTIRSAVEVTRGRVPLEASGNVTLANVREIANTGVDYISVGALTHSAPVLDISMHIE